MWRDSDEITSFLSRVVILAGNSRTRADSFASSSCVSTVSTVRRVLSSLGHIRSTSDSGTILVAILKPPGMVAFSSSPMQRARRSKGTLPIPLPIDIGRNHLVAVPAEYSGHGAVAAAWLPYLAAKADVPKQCLGHPGQRGIEVIPRALEGRHMNWPGSRCARGAARAWWVGARTKSVERQTELRHAHWSGFIWRGVMETLAATARLQLRGLVPSV
jgi:hypothetical protein